VRSLLQRLRKKLTQVLHRLRTLRFRFVSPPKTPEGPSTKAEDGRRPPSPPVQPGPVSGSAFQPMGAAPSWNVDDAFAQSPEAEAARDACVEEPARLDTEGGPSMFEPREVGAGLEPNTIGEECSGCESDVSREARFPPAMDERKRQPRLQRDDESGAEPTHTLARGEAVMPPGEAGREVTLQPQEESDDRAKTALVLSIEGTTPSTTNVEQQPEPIAPGSAAPSSVDTMEADSPVGRHAVSGSQTDEAYEPSEQLGSALEAARPSPAEVSVSAELDAAPTTAEKTALERSDAHEAVSAPVPELSASIVIEEKASPSADAFLEQPTAEPAELADIGHERNAAVYPIASDAKTRGSTETARRAARDRLRAPRPPPEHYEQSFVDPSLTPPAGDYALWNKAIVRHCLLEDAPKVEEVYLTITPRVLAGAIAEIGGGVLAPDEAENRLAGAVSRMYSTRVLPHPSKLQVLRRCGPDGLPECAAFLALSVLAAYRMHTDEGAAANAYYKRLDELLCCGLTGGLPRGFEPDEFEGLWLFMGAWLKREHRRQLAMPGPDVGVRRYVALPLTHVPLRQVDIERLPDFFDWAGYEPGGRVSIERIDADLSKWARSGAAFTNAGMDALADERRQAVLVQIAHELECWDGSHRDPQGRRIASVEVFLHWERRVPMLSYLSRRPAAFPSVFDDGVHVLDAGQDGWYEPLPIGLEDGAELQNGFSWEAASDGIHIVLHRTGASAIAMAPSEFAGPISHAGLLLNTSGAALCREPLVVPAQQYLEGVTGQRCMPLRHPAMPSGWTLFTGVKPVRRQQPPNGLEALEVLTNVEIIAQGGLRLGRRWAWLAEAPPKLLVAGFDPGENATIDGEPVELEEDGVLRDHGHLAEPGVHVVQVGRVRRRIEIVDPEVAVTTFADDPANDPRRVAALPWGSWAVIGSRPGTLAYALSRHRGQGILARCPFEAVWAISFGYGRGTVVHCISEQPPPPERGRRLSTGKLLQNVRAWADAIYNAHMRHPAFGSPWLSVHRPDIRAVWGEYVRIAKEIKRRLRAERR